MHRLALLSHKCGTLYTKNILAAICKKNKYEFVNFKALLKESDDSNRDLILEDKENTITFYPSSKYERVFGAINNEYRGFHIVRDPRDVVISGYFSHKYSHPIDGPWGQAFLVDHRKWLLSVSEEEGIMKEIDIAFALKTFQSWRFDDPNIMEIKFEELLKYPLEYFERIFDFLQLPVKSRLLARVVRQEGFQRRTGGRKPGQEDVHSHLRKGVHGDWKNYFTEDHKIYFKKKWGNMVVDLGYESHNNW